MRLPQLATPGWSPSTIMRSKPEAAGKSPAQAAMALEEFLSRGKATVCLSGAGISVDSNIPDYRGINIQTWLLTIWQVHQEHIP